MSYYGFPYPFFVKREWGWLLFLETWFKFLFFRDCYSHSPWTLVLLNSISDPFSSLVNVLLLFRLCGCVLNWTDLYATLKSNFCGFILSHSKQASSSFLGGRENVLVITRCAWKVQIILRDSFFRRRGSCYYLIYVKFWWHDNLAILRNPHLAAPS